MILAALLAVELSILGEAVVALRGASPGASSAAGAALGSELAEGGPPRTFVARSHPAVAIDIGYADLTIRTRPGPRIDVSLQPSSDYGFMRVTSPITAALDGQTVRIASAGGPGWARGDDRMVTVDVPPDTQVTVIDAGDIRAAGLRAQASLTSIGSGSITVEDYAAGSLHVASARGRIVLHGIVAARLDAASDEGRVEGTALHVHDGSVESGSRVWLGFAAGDDTLVDAQSETGRVTVSGFPTEAVLATSASESKAGEGSSRAVRLGDGEGHLDVHSSDGNITLANDG